MHNLLQSILPYLPPTLVRTVVQRTLRPNAPCVTDFTAAILFADISGFTPLTELLARRGAEGPEELTRLLNTYFSALISIIEQGGGEVAKFSGDALTVIFPATDEPLITAVGRAIHVANAVQRSMSEHARITTSVGTLQLALKIGIGAGEVRTFQVGGVFGRWEYLVAGDPIRQATAAENRAAPNEVVCSPEVQQLTSPESPPPHALAVPISSETDAAPFVQSLIGYVPSAVRAWLEGGLSEWIAVLRPITVLFLGIGGLDYRLPDALERVHACMCALQEATYRHEGSINKLIVDDKGTVLMILLDTV